MNKFLLIIVMLVIVCSCSDDVLNEENKQFMLGTSNATFSFDSIKEPSNWCKYQSLEEMLAACQIPENILQSMTTEELITVCMSHPLKSNYIFYNNEIEGVKVIVENFNGFQELIKRPDGPEKVIAFYEDINFDDGASLKYGKDFSGVTYLGFIELFLASNEMPQLYKGENGAKLEDVSNRVFEKKLAMPDVCTFDISHSLLINACIKLEKKNLSKMDRETLASFIKCGGRLGNLDEYTNISKITSK